jgi:hypothetical protein
MVHWWPGEQTAALLLSFVLQSVSPAGPGQHSPGVHADPQHTSALLIEQTVLST